MSTKGGVGQGLTASLSVDSTISRLRSVQLPEFVMEPVDFSGLSDLTWMCFLPASLTDPGSAVLEMFMNSEIARPTMGTVQVLTITFPIQTAGNTTNATLSASGFITNLAYPNAAIAEPLIETVTFKLDGNGTTPAFTLEAA